jgi:hypothetical protein
MADAAPVITDDTMLGTGSSAAPAPNAPPASITDADMLGGQTSQTGPASDAREAADPLSLIPGAAQARDKLLGKPWDQGPEGKPTREKVGAFASGMLSGVPFAKDVASAAVPYLAKGAPAGTYPTDYTHARDALDANTAALTQAHPGYSLAGNIAGGLVLAPVMPASSIGKAALSGGIYGAAQGAGEGRDRARRAAWGAGLGSVLGGTAGVVASPFRAASPEIAAARDAADQFGVDLPRAVAGSPAAQTAGHMIGATPLGGSISKATQGAIDQTGAAIADQAATIGSGTKQGAVDAAVPEIRNWMNQGFRDQAQRIYQPLTALNSSPALGSLPKTTEVAQDIMKQVGGWKTPAEQYTPAVQDILEAATRPEGVTFADMNGLRTELGRSAGWDDRGDQEGFKRLYGALTEDIRNHAQAIGGPEGAAAFDTANAQFTNLLDQRKGVAKLLGTGSDESVVDKFASKAMDNVGGQGRGGDLATLAKVKAAVPEATYNELVSSMVSHLAQQPDGSISMSKFLTEYGKMSPAAKTQVFSTPGAQQVRGNLDQIAKIAQVLQNAKPTGSHIGGQVAAVEQGLSFVEHLFSGRFGQAARIAGTAAAAKLGANYLASPVGSGLAARAMRAYGTYALHPSATTLTNLRNVAGQIGGITGAQVNEALQGPTGQ